MTRSPLLCCTSIIRSSPLVQASSSLSMTCACAWPTEAIRQRNPFPPFSREFHTHTHTHAKTHTPTCKTHRHTHAHIKTHGDTLLHTHTHISLSHSHTPTHTHTQTITHIHTNIHTHTHTQAHTHSQIHTCTNTHANVHNQTNRCSGTRPFADLSEDRIATATTSNPAPARLVVNLQQTHITRRSNSPHGQIPRRSPQNVEVCSLTTHVLHLAQSHCVYACLSTSLSINTATVPKPQY